MQKILLIFLILILSTGFIPLSQYMSFATHTETGTGEIHGIKWDDANNDGIFDIGTESVVSGVVITMNNSDNTIKHETITDINGEYWFTGLEPDSYVVRETSPPFTVQTFPVNGENHSIVLGDGDIVQNINFGNLFTGPSEIHGTIFEDVVNVGSFDVVDDIVISNQIVFLQKFTSTSPFPEFVDFTFTDLNGDYSFLNLEPGIYRVNSNFSPNVQTFPINNQLQVVTLSGQIETNVNIGFSSSFATITGTAFIDSNENGIKDVGELTASFNQICVSPGTTCTFTDGVGAYTLNLPSGTYDISSGQFFNTNTPTFAIIHVPSLVTGQVITDIDIPFLDLIPLPGDMEIPNSTGEIDGVPTLVRSHPLTLIKNISACIPIEAPLTTLTLSDGTILTQPMQNVPATTLWTNDFGVVNAAQTSANVRVDIDCPPDTPGYPDPTIVGGVEDVIQIGDLIFYDPSGQVINQCTNEPISDVTTTLKVAAPQGTTNFVIPQTSAHLPSTNPQITDSNGSYGWVTIPGDYIVTATKTGFESNTSPIVTIPPPVTGLDIFLTPVDGCLPTSQDFSELIDKIKSLDLQNGLENSLISKTNTAQNSFENGNITPTINKLNALLNQIDAQEGKKLSVIDADMLRNCVDDLIDRLSDL